MTKRALVDLNDFTCSASYRSTLVQSCSISSHRANAVLRSSLSITQISRLFPEPNRAGGRPFGNVVSTVAAAYHVLTKF